VDKKTKQVISTFFSRGNMHDFRVFKTSKMGIHSKVKVLADSGYQGIQNVHHNCALPKKNTKNNPLTKEDKIENQKISQERVLNENVIGMLKRFKIIADRYRNRRKRFGLRFNLISAIYNWDLSH
jgi:hypothetical protein